MTFYRHAEIQCDGVVGEDDKGDRQCLESVYDYNATMARRQAEVAGWLVGLPGGKDYCRKHRDQADIRDRS